MPMRSPMRALLIDDGALLVHDIVVLEEVLADAEVVALDFLLGTLDGLIDEGMLDDFALLEAKAVHDLGDTLGSEEAHELVFE